MQENESIMVVQCELRIPSLGMTVQHHTASLVMLNNYPRDRILSPHLKTIKDSYIHGISGIIIDGLLNPSKKTTKTGT